MRHFDHVNFAIPILVQLTEPLFELLFRYDFDTFLITTVLIHKMHSLIPFQQPVTLNAILQPQFLYQLQSLLLLYISF